MTARTCSRCGLADETESLACRGCGHELPKLQVRRSLASWSKLLGIVSWPLLILGGMGAVIAFLGLVTGVLAILGMLVRRTRKELGQALLGILLSAACIGLLTLVALPDLVIARMSQNEGRTIGSLRAIVAAEVEYSKANGGFYDSLTCLTTPGRCIPGADAGQRAFLDPAEAEPEVAGYSRTFHAGPPPAEPTENASRSSLTMFAVVAVPLSPGWTGRRAFCADGTGRICDVRDGSALTVEAGLCPATCTDLR